MSTNKKVKNNSKIISVILIIVAISVLLLVQIKKPEYVTKQFYRNYIADVLDFNHRTDTWSKEYMDRQPFTQTFRTKIEAEIALDESSPGDIPEGSLGYDPILCANDTQDFSNYIFDTQSVSNTIANIIITENSPGYKTKSWNVILSRENFEWKIDQIDCKF